MPLHHAFDAEFPPETAPPHCDTVLGYIGGREAARVWTLDEWLRFSHLRQFPIWVPDYALDPREQGIAACQAAHALGWHDGRAIIGDSETEHNREWWAVFAQHIIAGGFVPVDYGSLSTVLQNGAARYIVAAWDGIPDIAQGAGILGEQYAANVEYGGTRIDLSVLDDALFHMGGINPRI